MEFDEINADGLIEFVGMAVLPREKVDATERDPSIDTSAESSDERPDDGDEENSNSVRPATGGNGEKDHDRLDSEST